MAVRRLSETLRTPSVSRVATCVPTGSEQRTPYPDPVVAPAVSPESSPESSDSSSESPAGQDKSDGRTSRRHALVRVLLWMVVSTAAGVVLYLSGPPRTLWWLAPIAFAVLGWVIRDRR